MINQIRRPPLVDIRGQAYLWSAELRGVRFTVEPTWSSIAIPCWHRATSRSVGRGCVAGFMTLEIRDGKIEVREWTTAPTPAAREAGQQAMADICRSTSDEFYEQELGMRSTSYGASPAAYDFTGVRSIEPASRSRPADYDYLGRPRSRTSRSKAIAAASRSYLDGAKGRASGAHCPRDLARRFCRTTAPSGWPSCPGAFSKVSGDPGARSAYPP